MSTLLTIRTELEKLMNDTNYDLHLVGFYTNRVNAAQTQLDELTKMFQARGLVTTTSGTQEYSLPTNYMTLYPNSTKTVLYTDASGVVHTINKQTREYLREVNSDFYTVTGTPSYYYITPTKIGFYPTPDYSGSSNVALEMLTYSAALASDSASSDYPARYDLTIIYLAMKLTKEFDERFADAVYWENKALIELARVHAAHPVDSPGRQQGMSFYGK